MGQFKEKERKRQASLKTKAPFFTAEARAPGIYRGKPRDFCLPIANADENLFLGIRNDTLQYFANYGIQWHGGECGKPSNHLCDSQVCCVNFLAPFSRQPNALLSLMKPIFPNAVEALPIEDGRFVAFEWIGQQDYLGEGARTRGEHCTSADAIVRFRENDGSTLVALIEWKYTEDYDGEDLTLGSAGATRTSVHRPLYDDAECPLNHVKVSKFEYLFFEPLYQLMRQQFLAHEMEEAGEMGANRVVLLHLAPDHNPEFQKVTSPALNTPEATITGLWSDLLKDRQAFLSRSTETVFRSFPVDQFPALRGWRQYIERRYPWAF